VRSALWTGAGVGSLLLTLFVTGTMGRGAGDRRPPAGAAHPASAVPDRAPAAPRVPAAPPAAREADDPSGAGPCAGSADRASVFVFPFRPRPGQKLRILAVSRERFGALDAEVRGAPGGALVAATDRWGPGPFAWEFATDALAAGSYDVAIRVAGGGDPVGCSRVTVAPAPPGVVRVATGNEVWPVRRAWDGALEDLYSVWVSKLFRVSPDFHGGWYRLHFVLRNPDRNVLYGAFGLYEDGGAPEAAGAERPVAIRARADCGDLPYVLRAYFSWKFGLPFRFQRCNRRNALQGAECYEDGSNLTTAFVEWTDPVKRFNRFLETTLVNSVHSATPRTVPEDGASDFYPIAMTRAALRPGTVYVWPHGHLLVITDWEEAADGAFRMVAVDGHVDGTVTFKQFSRRNFPYLPGLRTFGFKAFRPVVFDRGEVRPVDNADLARWSLAQGFSEEQYRFRRSRDFYRAVQQVSSVFVAGPPGS
jgi:hypothetical protein